MNERIKELVVESGNGQFHNGKFYPHIGSRTTKDWEKFAELIVRECAKHAEHAKGIDVNFETYFKAMILGVEE